MAPGYHHRTATTTRRGARGGYPEHDDFEGLPVRQWRQEWVNIEPPPQPTTNQKNDRWAVDLPWGMPKDTHLLPQHSQELLRLARSGRLYKRKAPMDEEDAEEAGPGPSAPSGPNATPGLVPGAMGTSGADAEKAGDRKPGFSKAKDGVWVKVWKQVPRDAEVPTKSHLAKRPKNTIILPSKASTATFSGPTVTRVTVRRVDAAGNAYEQTVTVNDDTKLSQIGGEIISTTTIAAPAAVETLGQQQATPTKRRAPPPHKKKHKGPGRGRKKKLGVLPIPLPANPNGAANNAGGAQGPADRNAPGTTGTEVKAEDGNAANQDTEMADNSQLASDDEDDDDDDGEDGEEGDGKDEDMADDNENDDTMGDVPEQVQDVRNEQSQSQDQDQDQVMEDAEDDIRDAIRPSSIEEPSDDATQNNQADVETEVITEPHLYPPTNPIKPTGISHIFPPRHEGSPLKNVVLQSPTEPKSMEFPNIDTSAALTSAPEGSSSQTATGPSITDSQAPVESPKTNFTHPPRPQASHSLLPNLREPKRPQASPDDDGGLDLLGGLERELDRQSRTPSSKPAGGGSSS